MSEAANTIDEPSPETSQPSGENAKGPADKQVTRESKASAPTPANKFYQIRFRSGGRIHSASSKIQNLIDEELVMVQTDHGQEPARICGSGVLLPAGDLKKSPGFYTIARRASRDEVSKYDNLVQRERDALRFCSASIKKLGLDMKLIRVERFFNGSKIVFYFTAENRVDFRALVKELVQEFRTRVEMRQIGVRHETQMLGGLGCCGRELCCASFMTKFVPVSIKMAKEQNLPLNPSKISGACNRLLCCLTHEFDTYKRLKKDMPKPGKIILFEDEKYKVLKINILKSTVTVSALADSDSTRELCRDEWEAVEVVRDTRPAKDSAQQAAPQKQSGPQKQPAAKKQQAPRKQQNVRTQRAQKKTAQGQGNAPASAPKKGQAQAKNKKRRPQKKWKK